MLKFVVYVLIFLVLYRLLQIVYRIYLLQTEREKSRMTIRREETHQHTPSKADGEYIEYEEVK